jgi:hypothetical protein
MFFEGKKVKIKNCAISIDGQALSIETKSKRIED